MPITRICPLSSTGTPVENLHLQYARDRWLATISVYIPVGNVCPSYKDKV